ncbi:hypothetical protein K9M79_06885 [Candidatus Woesearchaeota archaeon]|nr:hypothetical protein [Candidatus Woesearchaeota archaeon]
MITGNIGEIASLYEGRSECFPNCELTKQDTEYIIQKIDYVNDIKKVNKTSTLNIHFPIYTLSGPLADREENLKVIRKWLKEMQDY